MNTHLQRLVNAANDGQSAARAGMSISACIRPNMSSREVRACLDAFNAELIVTRRLNRHRQMHNAYREAAE